MHEEADPADRERLPQGQIDLLWIRLTAIYGHRFVSAFGDDPRNVVGDTWARTLADLGPEDLARGLRACAFGSDDWPPTLPAFRAFCLEIPSFVEIRAALREHGGPNETGFLRLLWRYLDRYAFGRADQVRAESMLRDAYEQAREYRMSGGGYPAVLDWQPQNESIAPPRPNKSPRAEAMLEDLETYFGGEP